VPLGAEQAGEESPDGLAPERYGAEEARDQRLEQQGSRDRIDIEKIHEFEQTRLHATPLRPCNAPDRDPAAPPSQSLIGSGDWRLKMLLVGSEGRLEGEPRGMGSFGDQCSFRTAARGGPRWFTSGPSLYCGQESPVRPMFAVTRKEPMSVETRE